jgi:asparagine synthase (glutamine-hydrolysing)
MCGIVGVVAPIGKSQISETLLRMTDAIQHRGPNDHGHLAGDQMGIGMRRLSIIDVAGGHQPISNETEDIHVVCNGEIYNHHELRRELISRGHRFKTGSDTEVIVHLYEEFGDTFLHRLRGMFGLAIWDERKDRLFIARDRLGKKPIFYANRGDSLWFGSEMKSLLAADRSLSEPNHSALGQFLQFGYVHQPATVFANIHRLPAGHYGVWENDALTVHSYWSLEFSAQESVTEAEWQERLDAALLDSVKARLESEVPLGVFLSGGLDSSAVVAYAHRAGLSPIKTFTVAFDKPEWDESADALRVSEHFKTDHHVLQLSESQMRESFLETLESVTYHCDEPFGDPSAIPTYHISKLAREHVTVILSGDGGDELFAGYNSYRGALFAESYRRILPGFVGQQLLPGVASWLSRLLPSPLNYRMQRVAKVCRDSSKPIMEMIRSKASIWNQRELRELLMPDVFEGANYLGEQYLPDRLWQIMHSNKDLVSRMCEVDVQSYMLDDILVKVDRMSMAHSLEVRSPLLDQHLVELAARIPTRFKVNRKRGKLIFRDVVSKHLPPATVRKGKQGFSVPLRDWFRGELSGLTRDYLLSSGQLPESLFRRSTVERILTEHQSGHVDHANKIWLLMAYASWHKQTQTGPVVSSDRFASLKESL